MNKFKPFSQREILATSRLYESSTEGLQIVTEANLAYARSRGYIFLSHSNKDKALALAFVRYMERHGVKAYIDLYDSVLPLPPSAVTAQKLKKRIADAKGVILLATENSVHRSSWCPWEIGHADGISKPISIAATEDASHVYGAEYLGLYPALSLFPKIDHSVPQMAFVTCHRGETGSFMSEFKQWAYR